MHSTAQQAPAQLGGTMAALKRQVAKERQRADEAQRREEIVKKEAEARVHKRDEVVDHLQSEVKKLTNLQVSASRSKSKESVEQKPFKQQATSQKAASQT